MYVSCKKKGKKKLKIKWMVHRLGWETVAEQNAGKICEVEGGKRSNRLDQTFPKCYRHPFGQGKVVERRYAIRTLVDFAVLRHMAVEVLDQHLRRAENNREFILKKENYYDSCTPFQPTPVLQENAVTSGGGGLYM